MKIRASRVIRQRNAFTNSRHQKSQRGNVSSLQTTMIRAERVEESTRGARVWAECFSDKGSNLAITSQPQRLERQGWGCSQ